MKKFMFSIAFIILAASTYAQTDSLSNAIQLRSEAIGHNGNNELKVNLLYSILGLPEISYERLIMDNMGVGFSATIAVDDEQDIKSIFLATYRLYFGNKKANGFFIEGNTGVISEQRSSYYYYNDDYSLVGIVERNTNNFGLGAAFGAKFLTRHGLLGEAYLGAGRLFGNSYSGYYPRLGFTVGKRF